MNLNVHRYASIYILLLCDIVPKSFSLCVCFVCASAFRWYKKRGQKCSPDFNKLHTLAHTHREQSNIEENVQLEDILSTYLIADLVMVT